MYFLVLLTGSTPLKMYKKLVDYYKAGKVSFKYVKTFNMDEYVNLPRSHPESYHHFMFHYLFKVTDMDTLIRIRRSLRSLRSLRKIDKNLQN